MRLPCVYLPDAIYRYCRKKEKQYQICHVARRRRSIRLSKCRLPHAKTQRPEPRRLLEAARELCSVKLLDVSRQARLAAWRLKLSNQYDPTSQPPEGKNRKIPDASRHHAPAKVARDPSAFIRVHLWPPLFSVLRAQKCTSARSPHAQKVRATHTKPAIYRKSGSFRKNPQSAVRQGARVSAPNHKPRTEFSSRRRFVFHPLTLHRSPLRPSRFRATATKPAPSRAHAKNLGSCTTMHKEPSARIPGGSVQLIQNPAIYRKLASYGRNPQSGRRPITDPPLGSAARTVTSPPKAIGTQ